jgi:protein tyrosine phosphatase
VLFTPFFGLFVNEIAPIVVHDSAGVGRTGVFISSHQLFKEIMAQQTHKRSVFEVNVMKTVHNLRKQRIGMVQTVEQYLFIHIAIDTFFQAKPSGYFSYLFL